LWGVGPVTEARLAAIGVRTIGDLSRVHEDLIVSRLGSTGAMLARLARGQDDRPVLSSRPTRSISCERTLPEDTRDIQVLDHLIDRFARDLSAALHDEALMARTVVLKIRYSDFSDVTRSHTLRDPFDEVRVIAEEARRLLGRTGAGRRKTRLIGVTVSGLVGSDQPFQRSLFQPAHRANPTNPLES
ncbi:MAG TPA: DNA polymerase IV, partial [Patescibacteria group bacterium]|nr:DNA polymerase IV [Patescibacteria group bacterium]